MEALKPNNIAELDEERKEQLSKVVCLINEAIINQPGSKRIFARKIGPYRSWMYPHLRRIYLSESDWGSIKYNVGSTVTLMTKSAVRSEQLGVTLKVCLSVVLLALGLIFRHF